MTTTYEYDGRGMISSLRHTSDGQNLAKRDYWRDDRDRITAWKHGSNPSGGGPNGMEDGRGNRYHYDAEGELDLADYQALIDPVTGAVTDPKRRDTFNYDALGNRAGGNHVASYGDLNFTRRDNGLNQYLDWTKSAIYHDDNFPWPPPTPPPLPGNGVTMADGWITASFNALNQPMAMWCPTYGSNFKWFGYDPLGRCVKRWDGPLLGTPPNQYAPPPNSNQATYYYYDGWNLIQEGPNASTSVRTYVHGGRVDEIVTSQVDGLWYNHHYDAQGNCIMLTTTSGALQEQYDYDAFGMPYFYSVTGGKLVTANQWGNRFLFTGREWLQDLRIYDYRARQYQPELGRFLQPDPKEFAAGDYNLYRYCHNDPVNKSDPTGLQVTSDIWNDKMRFQSGSIFSSREFNLLRQGQAYLAPPTGNYKDANVENHVARNGETRGNPGLTKYTVSDVEEADGKLIIKPTLNWHVLDRYKNTDVVKRELEHVSRYLWWQSKEGDGAAMVRSFNRNPTGIDDLKRKAENARQDERQWQVNNLHKDGRHDLSRTPEKAMDPAAIRKLIENVGPVEEPY